MRDSKIYHFLESLGPVQLNRLSRYLESPYFNRNEKLLKIYYTLERNIRSRSKEDPDKQLIWDSIYPGVVFNDSKFRKHCSELLDLGEAFLAQQIYDENPLHQANNLLQAVHQRQIPKLFNSSQSKAALLTLRQSNRNASYYYYMYEIEKNLYKLNDPEVNRVIKSSISKINLESIVNNLDYFYIAEKLKYYCSLLSWNRIVALDTQILFIEEIIEIAKKKEFAEIPPVSIYLKIYETFIYPDQIDYYWELKQLIEKYLHLFPSDEAKEIIEAAINYNIRNANKDIAYQIELLSIYKKGLETEVLFPNGEMSPWTFKNIITQAVRLKEFTWAEQFIKTYSERLNPSYKDNAVHYNLALIHFHKREFHKVIPLLQKVEYDEIFYGLNSKAIMVSTYFDMGEFFALGSFLESFRNFLARDKNLSQVKKNTYLNLVKFTKILVDIHNGSTRNLEKLKNEIIKENAVGKDWLLEKVDELLYSTSPSRKLVLKSSRNE